MKQYGTRLGLRFIGWLAGLTNHPNLTVDDRRRRFHAVLLALTGTPFFIGFGIANAVYGDPVVAWLSATNLISLMTGLFLLRRLDHGTLVFRYFLLTFYLLMAWLFFHGGPFGAKSIWVMVAPLVAFFLMGKREGCAWAVGLATVLIVATMIGWPVADPDYPTPVLIRLLSVYAVITGLTYGFENYRQQSQDRFESERTKLQAETAALKHEITERQQSDAERQRLAAELERSERMRAIGTLAGGVAHDLNNILSGLVNYPELLLMEMQVDNPHRRRIEAIKKSGLKAAAIVQDLLALARRGVSNPSIISLSEVIRDYMGSLEFQKMAADHPRVAFKTDFRRDCDTIYGSAVHLSKAVMNLVTNAAEAMPDGGVCQIATDTCAVASPPVYFPSLPPGRYVTLTVSDVGVGISIEDQSRIFEPFYSRKHVGRSGSGLGMAVIWHTIQDHGGYIHTDSQLGHGTSFTIYLPSREADVACAQPNIGSDGIPLSSSGQHVLIVDDEAEQRRIGVEVLNRLGYRVITASNGDGALALLERLDVDLVMLDMILENGSDGLDVYQRIQHLRPGQRVIIVSGFSESQRVQTALAQGACAYLRKPYTIRQLGDAVQQALAA